MNARGKGAKMKWAVLAGLLLVPAPADAAMNMNTAQEMETNCRLIDSMDRNTPLEAMDAALCIGFVDGVNETMALWKGIAQPAPFCLPEKGISVDQARRLFLKHLQDNPKDLNRRAGLVYIEAIHNAFPCPAK